MGWLEIIENGKVIESFGDKTSNEVREQTWVDENNVKHSEIECVDYAPPYNNIFNDVFQKQLNAYVKKHYKSLVKKP